MFYLLMGTINPKCHGSSREESSIPPEGGGGFSASSAGVVGVGYHLEGQGDGILITPSKPHNSPSYAYC